MLPQFGPQNHDSELGCALAHKLFVPVKAAHKEGVTAPRGYDDCTVTVGAELHRKPVGGGTQAGLRPI